MAALMRSLSDRVRSDFLMPSRLAVYRALLESALEEGFRVCSVSGIWRLITAEGLDPRGRYLVLRHDVDTGWRTAAAMWAIDADLGVESTYFFRLSTLAPTLMAQIGAGGSEASYHYEELATVARRRGLATRAELTSHVAEARDQFATNITRVRAETGLPMRVVAAHGDFVNRRVGIPNWVILDDAAVRRQVGIDLETYDEAYLQHLPSRYTDAPFPQFWMPEDPGRAIRAGAPILALTLHPRHWQVERVENARDDLGRLAAGLRFDVLTALRKRT
jgi:hypothetical protein